jgi:hypothetical protein
MEQNDDDTEKYQSPSTKSQIISKFQIQMTQTSLFWISVIW